MNHYEELAVAQDVSLEEIHQAYQALARLLHPDNQSDPKLTPASLDRKSHANQNAGRQNPRQLPGTFCPIRSK